MQIFTIWEHLLEAREVGNDARKGENLIAAN
jgi:hypothetical protein